MGPIIFLVFVMIAIIIYGITQTRKSNRLKKKYGAALHSVGIHYSGLPQVPEGKKVDVLLGNGNLYIQADQQIFELSLSKVSGVHHPNQREVMKFQSFLIIGYHMNGRHRKIKLAFFKSAVAKTFLWEIERQLFTNNSSNGVIRL
ncbi:hypothetical protein SAMN05720606_106293 [Paenibacillus polysaccharolyticus]|uniref:Uncharacterized protein n=1 Tax=Paenibacillus polysaccharolyticus TaxID=582692 RepID=A0A1G5H9P9_9BACL|nr:MULTISPECIES: hypothetical protein [Paenibacillus]MDP9700787.1 hypothetical protein [Paenibacillus intestini]SCY60615.1 hypothetical protein SAMN05720606_106293 [Paenibacillus polysaccharolyticus]